MHALFFEMRPKPGHLDHYFDHVARLRPVLARHEGLVFLERYASQKDPGLLLSHQLWENEESIVAWRKNAEHRRSQAAGSNVHFADYRIRVGERILHWLSSASDTPARAEPGPPAPCVLALYGTHPVHDPMFSSFESFTREGQFISLASFHSLAEVETALSHGNFRGIDEIAAYGIHRDYGQFDRAQAPR